MKLLYLLRHAKSSWSHPGLADHERPLNGRGTRDAPRMGAALRRKLQPLPVMASSAKRAQLTLTGLCTGWPELGVLRHRCEPMLYTFSPDELSRFIQSQDNNLPALFLIGHNPALTELVNGLAPDCGLSNLPTAGFVALRLQTEQWSALRPGCGRVASMLFPKQL